MPANPGSPPPYTLLTLRTPDSCPPPNLYLPYVPMTHDPHNLEISCVPMAHDPHNLYLPCVPMTHDPHNLYTPHVLMTPHNLCITRVSLNPKTHPKKMALIQSLLDRWTPKSPCPKGHCRVTTDGTGVNTTR